MTTPRAHAAGIRMWAEDDSLEGWSNGIYIHNPHWHIFSDYELRRPDGTVVWSSEGAEEPAPTPEQPAAVFTPEQDQAIDERCRAVIRGIPGVES